MGAMRWPGFTLVLTALAATAGAQDFDLVIRGGRVIDPANGIDGVMDVGMSGGTITAVAAGLAASPDTTVVDAVGMIVTPGLVDLHAHVFFGTEPNAYLSNSDTALAPDGFTLRSGVTTVVDLGGAGWRNFEQLKRQVIDRSVTRVLAFLNIVGSGMKGGPVEQNLADMDARLTAMRAEQYPEHVVGVKLAHYAGPEWDPVERAVEAGRLAGIPVAIDFGGHEPPLSLEELLLERLRPGDVFTHTYAHVRGRIPIVDEDGELRPFVRRARERGIVFDVGHGGGSFLFSQAVPAMRQGFAPRHDQHRPAPGKHERRDEEHAQRDVEAPRAGHEPRGRRGGVDVESRGGHPSRGPRPSRGGRSRGRGRAARARGALRFRRHGRVPLRRRAQARVRAHRACRRRGVGPERLEPAGVEALSPEERRFALPDIYVILTGFILVVAALTWIVPAGAYDRAALPRR